MAVPWWLIAQGAKIGMDYLGGKAKQDRMRDLSNITPAERDYVKRQRDIVSQGDPSLQGKLNKQTSAIRQQGNFERSRVQGGLIRQGLENSIISDELRRKVDKNVMDQISEESGKIAEQNRLAKLQAEENITNFELKRDERLRQIAMQTPTDSELLLQAGQSAVGMGLDYLGTPEFVPGSDGKKGTWNYPSLQTGKVGKSSTKYKYDWEDPSNYKLITGMDDASRAEYLSKMDVIQRGLFKKFLQSRQGEKE